MSEQPWRLLVSGGASGARNMALDDAILAGCSEGTSPPTLRLYWFEPPCLSLGKFQLVDRDADSTACRERGIEIVQRPTGGRAVLHWGDLVYAVIAPEGDPMVAGGILDSYRRIGEALERGLSRLGLPNLESAPRKERLPRTGAGFDLPAAYELTLDGKKLTGSAQVRRAHGVLQHGSILIDERALDIDGLLRVNGVPVRVPRPSAVTLPGALGRPVERGEVVEAVRAGFAECVPGLKVGGLTAGELDAALRLRYDRYPDPIATR